MPQVRRQWTTSVFRGFEQMQQLQPLTGMRGIAAYSVLVAHASTAPLTTAGIPSSTALRHALHILGCRSFLY